MKIAGIVAEYNPFHSGHAYQIDRTRSEDGGGATHIAAVMSGSFVQRGSPPCFPNPTGSGPRSREGWIWYWNCPFPGRFRPRSTLPSARFRSSTPSAASASSASAVNAGISTPSHGVADTLDSPRFSSLLRYHLDMGIAFPGGPAAGRPRNCRRENRGTARKPQQHSRDRIHQSPARSPLSYDPYTVARFGAGHADVDRPLGNIASATYLRTLLRADRLLEALPYIPAGPARFLSDATQAGRAPSKEERLDRAVLARLRMLTPEDAARLPDLSEGSRTGSWQPSGEAASLPGLMETIKTRRYPMTPGPAADLVGVPRRSRGGCPPRVRPIRVLGANQKGPGNFGRV